MRILTLLTWFACAPDDAATPPTDDTGTADTDPCAPPGDRTLTIGLGYTGFEAVENGGVFPLIHGPQGGYHIEVGLFATNLSAATNISGVVTGTIDGEVWAESYPVIALRCIRDGDLGDGQESYGTLLVAQPGWTPEDLDGRTTTVTATLTDLDGIETVAEGSYLIEDTE